MGRNIKYKTQEERLVAQRAQRMDYYRKEVDLAREEINAKQEFDWWKNYYQKVMKVSELQDIEDNDYLLLSDTSEKKSGKVSMESLKKYLTRLGCLCNSNSMLAQLILSHKGKTLEELAEIILNLHSKDKKDFESNLQNITNKSNYINGQVFEELAKNFILKPNVIDTDDKANRVNLNPSFSDKNRIITKSNREVYELKEEITQLKKRILELEGDKDI